MILSSLKRVFVTFLRIPVLTDCLVCLLAVVDLNGRYFGGRVVKACFYNLDKFRVLDLAEQV